MKVLFLLVVALSAGAFGKGFDKALARRIEVSSNREFQEPLDKLRPERAYAVWAKALGHWIFVLTDEAGKVRDPVEALAPGTVLPFFKVGGEEGKRYLLTKQGTWKSTRAPYQRRVWQLGKVSQYRVFLSAETPRRRLETRNN